MSGEASAGGIADAAAAAMRGELVVVPTDTVYGIGTRPDDPSATRRVFDVKRRPRTLELHLVLVPSIASAREIASFHLIAARLAAAWWPGGLTSGVAAPRACPSAWDLGGDQGTIGVRMPTHGLARAVLDRTDRSR